MKKQRSCNTVLKNLPLSFAVTDSNTRTEHEHQILGEIQEQETFLSRFNQEINFGRDDNLGGYATESVHLLEESEDLAGWTEKSIIAHDRKEDASTSQSGACGGEKMSTGPTAGDSSQFIGLQCNESHVHQKMIHPGDDCIMGFAISISTSCTERQCFRTFKSIGCSFKAFTCNKELAASGATSVVRSRLVRDT